jgi:hypothetical protein
MPAVATASLVAVSGLGVAAVAASAATAARPAVPSAGHRSAASAASPVDQLVITKLAANGKYPFSQIDLSFPQISGKGISALDAAVVSGLQIEVLSAPGGAGKQPIGEVSVNFKGVQLAQLRTIGGNLYGIFNIQKWSVLPLHFSKSTTTELSSLDAAFGERWLELPAAELAQLEKKLRGATKAAPPAATLTSPAAAEQLALGAATQFVAGLSLNESSLPGGNEAFTSSGTLASLEVNAIAAEAEVEKAVGGKVKTSTATKPPAGTYSLRITTSGNGAYVGQISFAFSEPGQGSGTVQLNFSHRAEPFGVPAGARVIPSSMLGSL